MGDFVLLLLSIVHVILSVNSALYAYNFFNFFIFHKCPIMCLKSLAIRIYFWKQYRINSSSERRDLTDEDLKITFTNNQNVVFIYVGKLIDIYPFVSIKMYTYLQFLVKQLLQITMIAIWKDDSTIFILKMKTSSHYMFSDGCYSNFF